MQSWLSRSSASSSPMSRAAISAIMFSLLPLASGAPTPAPLAVFGHKIPDTDAICAAMVYTWELELRGIPAKAYRLGELNRETEYVLQKLGIELPPLLEGKLEPGADVAIVDTNNPEELPEGIHKANIHSIIDHHKLSGLTTNAPLEADVRTLCSTGSILYARAKYASRVPPKNIAAMMLACILSDSLEFRSPTTTPLDIEFANELAKIAGIDLHEFASAMLDAKAEIGHLTPKEIVMMDTKIYEIGGKRLRISVVETTRPERSLDQRATLVEAQLKIKAEQGLDDVLLFVVDVLNQQATFVSSSDTAGQLVEQAWGATLSAEGTAVLPGVLSRKKQIIPKLEAGAAKAAHADGVNVDAGGAARVRA